MELVLNSIITLENKEKYIVLSETVYQAKKYFLVMGIKDNREIDSQNVAIFGEEKEGLDIFITKVEDPELKIILTDMLKAQE